VRGTHHCQYRRMRREAPNTDDVAFTQCSTSCRRCPARASRIVWDAAGPDAFPSRHLKSSNTPHTLQYRGTTHRGQHAPLLVAWAERVRLNRASTLVCLWASPHRRLRTDLAATPTRAVAATRTPRETPCRAGARSCWRTLGCAWRCIWLHRLRDGADS
jgi:hypothetical protein